VFLGWQEKKKNGKEKDSKLHAGPRILGQKCYESGARGLWFEMTILFDTAELFHLLDSSPSPFQHVCVTHHCQCCVNLTFL
jgi:hypothetical protein